MHDDPGPCVGVSESAEIRGSVAPVAAARLGRPWKYRELVGRSSLAQYVAAASSSWRQGVNELQAELDDSSE